MTAARLVRRIAARPDIVWDALVTADGIGSWWGPDDLPVISALAEPRVGGGFEVRFRTSDGREHVCAGADAEIPRRRSIMTMTALHVMLALVCLTGPALAESYPAMADVRHYRMARADEIALAKSAAPASIADHAEVQVLGARGYEIAVTGTNGFVCLVVRSGDVSFAEPQFWNPKIRSPQCMNAAAVRSVLPRYLTRTQWVLAGVAKAELQRREAAAHAAGKLGAPAADAMCYMMSKNGYLNDDVAHWHPHVMIYTPREDVARWGANLPGSPVMADDHSYDDTDIFFIVVGAWSDGTAAAAM